MLAQHYLSSFISSFGARLKDAVELRETGPVEFGCIFPLKTNLEMNGKTKRANPP